MTDAAHRPEEPGLAEAVAERPAGVGRAVIAVVDRARRGPPVPDCHLQGVDDQLGADVVGHRPADDAAAEAVQDDGEVVPASLVRCWVMSAT